MKQVGGIAPQPPENGEQRGAEIQAEHGGEARHARHLHRAVLFAGRADAAAGVVDADDLHRCPPSAAWDLRQGLQVCLHAAWRRGIVFAQVTDVQHETYASYGTCGSYGTFTATSGGTL